MILPSEADPAVHQLALSFTPLQSWTLSSARIGLVGMNKEGIVSLPGYLAIYLLGLATGEHILRTASPPDVKKAVSETPEQHAQSQYRKRRTELGLELFGYAVAWWCALGLCRAMGMEVSRRLVSETNYPRRSARDIVDGPWDMDVLSRGNG